MNKTALAHVMFVLILAAVSTNKAFVFSFGQAGKW